MSRYPKGSGLRPRNEDGTQPNRFVPSKREGYGTKPLDNLIRAYYRKLDEPMWCRWNGQDDRAKDTLVAAYVKGLISALKSKAEGYTDARVEWMLVGKSLLAAHQEFVRQSVGLNTEECQAVEAVEGRMRWYSPGLMVRDGDTMVFTRMLKGVWEVLNPNNEPPKMPLSGTLKFKPQKIQAQIAEKTEI